MRLWESRKVQDEEDVGTRAYLLHLFVRRPQARYGGPGGGLPSSKLQIRIGSKLQ